MATLKQKLAVKEIKLNPSNPRLIKDDKFKKLVQSLKDFPEMLDAREIVVNKDNVILGGNMRFRAAKEAGLTEVPVKIVDWPEDKQREFVIKDNVSGGEWDWDILANEWGELPLDEWITTYQTFSPNIAPNFNESQLTQEIIAKKEQELENQMIKASKKIQVVCPTCGEEFEIKV